MSIFFLTFKLIYLSMCFLCGSVLKTLPANTGAACWGLSKMLVVLMMVGETEEEEKPEAENKWTIWKL